MFISPAAGDKGIDYRITQWFGSNRAYYSKYGLSGHNGTADFAMSTGTTVYAPHDGYVSTGDEGRAGYGKYVMIISDPLGPDEQRYRSDLAHLSGFLVENGQFVRAGDPVGLSGNTGDSTGPHLHWTFKKLTKNGDTLNHGNGYKGALDVAKYTLPNYPERTLRK